MFHFRIKSINYHIDYRIVIEVGHRIYEKMGD